MAEPRLKAELWAKAYIRICSANMVQAVVVRHGNNDAGVVLLKINTLGQGCHVFQPSTNMDGNRVWRLATGAELVPEAEANAYIDRQISFDRDLWVIEVEDREGRNFLPEPVVDP